MTLARLSGVHKAFGSVQALRGVDLAIGRGEVVALLGPNGAGKTTALRIVFGLRRPDAGTALLFGRPPHEPAARKHCGWTPQETSFPGSLRVHELVEFACAHYPHATACAELLGRFALFDLAHRQAGGLSGGERRRLALALAFAGAPDLVVLDEPTTGLDVESRRLLWTELGRYVERGGTVLLTTHYLEEAERLGTRIVVLVDGAIVATGSVDAIRAAAGLTRITILAPPEPPRRVEGILRCEQHGDRMTLYVRDAGTVVHQLVEAGVTLDALEVTTASLEDAFLQLTSESP